MSQPSPCCSTPPCDPSKEPLASSLNNFIAAFFGTLTKTCINGEVVWTLPCNLDAGITGWPRIAGEGLACYFARVLAGIVVSGTPLCTPAGGNNGVSTSASRCDHKHLHTDITDGLTANVTVVTSVDWASPDLTKTEVALNFENGILISVGAPVTTTITTAEACS